MQEQFIRVLGAKEHNLKNIDVSIPRDKITVITGLSGSGKSSLALDTVYAEGQRRYIETFSPYARRYMGEMKRPKVDNITGLSSVIAIEQKTTSKNPRSTVGTITELYDYFRLLYARAAMPYSYVTGKPMVKYSAKKTTETVFNQFKGAKILLLSPIIKGRKGSYKELFIKLRKKGYWEVRVNGKILELVEGLQLDRYKTHDIEILIDKLFVSKAELAYFKTSLETAMKQGNGSVIIHNLDKEQDYFFSSQYMCAESGISYEEPSPHTFSFNSPRGACPRCNGLGIVQEFDIKKIIPDDSKNIYDGGILPLGKFKDSIVFWQMQSIAEKYNFTLKTPIKNIPGKALSVILNGAKESIKIRNSPLGKSSSYYVRFEGILNYMADRERLSTSKLEQKWVNRFITKAVCLDCKGDRLKKESLHFLLHDKNIARLAEMHLDKLYEWVQSLPSYLTKFQKTISHEILKEITPRVKLLLDLGLEYLSMNRPTATLSGGESQRIRLVTQLGSQLVNVLYILDEPSIGLHQRDNLKLIKALGKLKNLGNTVIIVEHDREIISSADFLVDLGPKAGNQGGEVIIQDYVKKLNNHPSLTLQYLKGERQISYPKKRRKGTGHYFILKKCSGNNLKNIDVKFPLGKFICVTGVSGSGKSTLINSTLFPCLSQFFYKSIMEPYPFSSFEGIEHLNKVIEVNQAPIGKTPRSNPATYTKIFTDIRKLFEMIPEAKIRGYKANRFSFNIKGGRCETCQGAGLQTIEMRFLPNVLVECKDCRGKRYNRETLEIRYKGHSINDILEMTITDAITFFKGVPSILSKLKLMYEVGLGYIHLGQPSTTLSGGEAQRVKLAAELGKRDTGKTMYLLDEPTTGLHFEDINILLKVLNKLVDRGNTVIIIEHNMDIIKNADYIIDLGPDAGEKGGNIVYQGTPEGLITCKKSYTGKYLKSAF